MQILQQLDSVLSSGNRQLLQTKGTVSHKQAVEKAKTEYRKYQEKTIAPVEQAYLDSIKTLEKEAKKKVNNPIVMFISTIVISQLTK